jgi:tyrosyl-tRNA synthetase
MSAFAPVEEQLAVILRGAIPPTQSLQDELRKKLERSRASGKPLRAKLGIDPTGADLHLGHTVVLRKLRQFQLLGHQVVLIIGTATARVGDPSGRDETRKALSPEKIEENARTYLAQVGKLLDVSKIETPRNGDWFDRFSFADVQKLLGHMTAQQMLAREDFAKRYGANPSVPIFLHEFLYPLMQGHDSVEVRADVELGGTEQLFNLMVARDLQQNARQEPQIPLTMPILRGLDGEKKMGKSLDNYIAVAEAPKDQFGKTMRIPDALMDDWFTLLTDRSREDVNAIIAGHPNEAKKRLATDIVTFYHGREAAEATLADWNKQFSGSGAKQDPDHIDDVLIPAACLQNGSMPVIDLLVETKLVTSRGEARRKIEENGFNYGPDRTRPADAKATVPVTDGLIVRLGRKILRVRLS